MHASLVTSYRGLDGRAYLGVLAKRRYAFRHDARAEPVDEPAPIHVVPAYAPGAGGLPGPLLHDTDLVAGIKPATDVLLRGTAYSHRGPVRSLAAVLLVDPAGKAVQAIGDRRIVLGAGGAISFTRSEPFTTMPLTWDRAYGGRDTYAESKEPAAPDRDLRYAAGSEPALGGLSYPRNPYGRGFLLDLDRERIAGAPLPNLEDGTDETRPNRLLCSDYDRWIDCPVAACFEPIDVFTFPRALFFVPPFFAPPVRSVHEVVTSTLTRADLARMDEGRMSVHPRSFNCAPAGLANHRLYGGEHAKLWNLHREREQLELDLPGDRPRLLVEPPGVNPREMEPLLQTVLFEPDADRVTLTWAGAIQVAAVYPQEMTAAMRHGVVWTR